MLTEAAWHYRLKPKVSAVIQKRQEGQSKPVRLIAWKAQERLHKRFRQLSAKKKSVVAATVVARELAAFVWAIARSQTGRPNRPPRRSFAPARGKVYRRQPEKKFQKHK